MKACKLICTEVEIKNKRLICVLSANQKDVYFSVV